MKDAYVLVTNNYDSHFNELLESSHKPASITS